MDECECKDEDGISIYPYYGVAPHTHKKGPMVGSTVIEDHETWPSNFEPDIDDGEDIAKATTGTYTHCLICGSGDK